jgi:hypothetical protein
LQAVADLQPALASLVTDSCAPPAEESFDRLFQSREALHPLLPCVQGDRKAQVALWEAFLEGKRSSLPDWTRASLPDNETLLRYISMAEEDYIRDLWLHHDVEYQHDDGHGCGHDRDNHDVDDVDDDRGDLDDVADDDHVDEGDDNDDDHDADDHDDDEHDDVDHDHNDHDDDDAE